MPYLADGVGGGGGGAGAPAPTGPVIMQVAPDQILALMARYEAVRDTVQEFLANQRANLLGQSVADDDVSRDAASTFTENATTAIDVTTEFLVQLSLSIDQLNQAAKTYNLVEDVNIVAMQQDRGI
ncbi:PE domain-containing protein [Actinosynnema sp. NPDC002837]